ncbi:MAG: hypothetical protein ACRCVI_03255 [Mycoplasmoidaceae bacterium]
MKSSKKYLKLSLLALGGVLPLLSLPFLTFFYTHNESKTYEVYMDSLGTDKEILSGESKGKANTIDASTQDALYKDAYNKAMYDKDSILVYSIYWFGVLHRFGLISHVLAVLDINPNHKIYILETSGKNNYDPLYATNTDGTRKYPNVYVETKIDQFSSPDSVWWMNQRYLTPTSFYEKVEKENTTNANIHHYLADWTILSILDNYFKGGNLPILKKNIYDNWAHFNKGASFNLFCDGTGSIRLYSKELYDYFLKANVGLWDATNKGFSNAIKLRQDLYHERLSVAEFTENNNAILFLLSLITTEDFNNDNIYPSKDTEGNEVKYQDTQFFLGTTQFVKDLDDVAQDDTIPNGFLKTKNGDKFNPYKSVEMDLLSAIRKLKPATFDDLVTILGVNINDFNEQRETLNTHMDGSYNIVHSGTLLTNNPVTQNSEAETIKAMYNLAKKSTSKPVKIIFKGHPRDYEIETIRILLENSLKEICTPELFAEIQPNLLIPHPNIPYEVYLTSGIFDPNPATAKEVKLYSSYSTIVWLLYADGRIDDLEGIVVPNNNNQWIIDQQGRKSPIFNKTIDPEKPNNRLITIQDLIDQANNLG